MSIMLHSTAIDCLVADLSGRELAPGISRPNNWYQLLVTPSFKDGDLSRDISYTAQQNAFRLCNQAQELIERVFDELYLGFTDLKNNLEDYQAGRISVDHLQADRITARTYGEVNLCLQQVRGLGRELALAGLPEAWLQVSEIIHGVSNVASGRLGWMKTAQEAQLYPAEDEHGAILPLDFETIIQHLNSQAPLTEARRGLETMYQRLNVAVRAPFAATRLAPGYGDTLELTNTCPTGPDSHDPGNFRRPVSLLNLGQRAFTEALYLSRLNSPPDIAFTNLSPKPTGNATSGLPVLPYSLEVVCEVIATELLRNAVQALSREHHPGEIHFEGKYAPGQEITITVLDNGPGITPATVRSLARSRQESDDLLKSGQGFGIILEALAITGGNLSVFPAHRNGHGAGFKATLPFPY